MARIFITGSSNGLGLMAAKQLVLDGHHVVLHARNIARGQEALASVPGAETVLIGDLSDMKETRQLAADVNALGNFDAIIHNAGVVYLLKGFVSFKKIKPWHMNATALLL